MFRYLGAKREGFTIQEWKNLNRKIVHDSIIDSLFRLLEEEKLLSYSQGYYKINHENRLQRHFEAVHLLTETIDEEELFKEKSKLLWTVLPNYSLIPSHITDNFQHLNSWIQHIIQTTMSRLIFIAPYYSVAGIKHLSTSLSALLELKDNVEVDWIIGETENDGNKRALDYLLGTLGASRIRVFEPIDNKKQTLVNHSKALLSDNERGYLGSANFSHRGLHNQFELGVKLTKEQTLSLTLLVDYWIKSSQLIPYSKESK